MSQAAAILAHLKAGGTLTHLEAIDLFRCARLAARIDELREVGYRIDTEMRSAGGKRYGVYRLAQPQQMELVP